MPVLAPGTGKTKTGRLWTYVRYDRPSADLTAPAVWVAYSPDRKESIPSSTCCTTRAHCRAGVPASALACWGGDRCLLGFHHLYEGGAIYEVACWAHARRKFHEINIAHASPTTTEAIERIAQLYAIEREIRGSTAETRRFVHHARAKPLLDSMHIWLQSMLTLLSRKSDTAAAIRYALSRYVDDGQLEIDIYDMEEVHSCSE